MASAIPQPHILVVEDHAPLREQIVALLLHAGCCTPAVARRLLHAGCCTPLLLLLPWTRAGCCVLPAAAAGMAVPEGCAWPLLLLLLGASLFAAKTCGSLSGCSSSTTLGSRVPSGCWK